MLLYVTRKRIVVKMKRRESYEKEISELLFKATKNRPLHW